MLSPRSLFSKEGKVSELIKPRNRLWGKLQTMLQRVTSLINPSGKLQQDYVQETLEALTNSSNKYKQPREQAKVHTADSNQAKHDSSARRAGRQIIYL